MSPGLCLTVLSFVACTLAIGIDIGAYAIAADDSIGGVVGLQNWDCIVLALWLLILGFKTPLDVFSEEILNSVAAIGP